MKKRKVNNKGITLIALVIAIIIIIILAGITVRTLLGNNGLITRTKKAVEYYEKAQEDEIIEMDKLYTRLASIREVSGVTEAEMKRIITEIMYPIGSIYISTQISTKEEMESRFEGEWKRYAEGRTLIGVGTGEDKNGIQSIFNINEKDGEYEHKLIMEEMPSHSHKISNFGYNGGYGADAWYPTGQQTYQTSKTGGDKAHNNIQPYIVVYMWQRIS